MDNLEGLNIPMDVSWAPWILAIVLVLGATAIAITVILRPPPGAKKLLVPLIGAFVSLMSAAGGYLYRTPEVEKKEVNLERAYMVMDLYEKTVDELSPVG